MSAGKTWSNNRAILLRAEAACGLSHGILLPAFLLPGWLEAGLGVLGIEDQGATEPSAPPITGGTYSPSDDTPAGMERLSQTQTVLVHPPPGQSPLCPTWAVVIQPPRPTLQPPCPGALRPSVHPLATACRNWRASIGSASWYSWRPESHLPVSVASPCFSWAALTPWGNAVLVEKVPHAWAFVHRAGGVHSQQQPTPVLATHPSIIAWKSPRSEEPGGLQSMESQRAGHD